MIRKKIVLFILLAISTLSPSLAQALDTHEVLGFVKDFYQTYNRDRSPSNQAPTFRYIFSLKKKSFSEELIKAIEEDLQAQDKASGKSVGLDFDPFIHSQDPGASYKVGQVEERSGTFKVAIHEVREGKISKKPNVWARLTRENNHWVFSNFHYDAKEMPEQENLLSVLKILKTEREDGKAKK